MAIFPGSLSHIGAAKQVADGMLCETHYYNVAVFVSENSCTNTYAVSGLYLDSSLEGPTWDDLKTYFRVLSYCYV